MDFLVLEQLADDLEGLPAFVEEALVLLTADSVRHVVGKALREHALDLPVALVAVQVLVQLDLLIDVERELAEGRLPVDLLRTQAAVTIGASP